MPGESVPPPAYAARSRRPGSVHGADDHVGMSRGCTVSRRHRHLWRGLLVAALVPLTACTPGGPDRSSARVEVEAGPVLVDEPLRLRVTGLEPGARVTVGLRGARGGDPVEAEFVAEEDGEVDLLEDAPVAGSSYDAASGFGLLWQLDLGDGLGTVEAAVSVDGEPLDVVSQTRVLSTTSVRSRRLRPRLDGIAGRYYAPTDLRGRRPGVVLFGGSEGGLSVTAEAQLLASHGYPTVALAYFDWPGVPDRLRRVQIEYFALALAWLSLQPGVDPDRVVPWGVSRGSEAALLVASLKPDLAAGAIGLAPNGVALGDPTDPSRPAWTWRGRPVPWATTLRERWYEPGDAVIDVWDVDGPILLVCGEADRVWAACGHSEDIASELAQRGAPPPTLLAYDDVGHEIGFVVPGAGGAGRGAGADLEATGLARADAWEAVLDHLDRL